MPRTRLGSVVLASLLLFACGEQESTTTVERERDSAMRICDTALPSGATVVVAKPMNALTAADISRRLADQTGEPWAQRDPKELLALCGYGRGSSREYRFVDADGVTTSLPEDIETRIAEAA